MYLFLGLNGFRIEAPEEEVAALILSLAAGQLEESELAAWLRQHITLR
jgi:death-on-curing protein